MSASAVKKVAREAWGLGLYRIVLTFILLVAAFSAFPAHKLPIGLAVLAFNQGVSAVGIMIKVTSVGQNYLADMAERKTRHSIMLAAERSGQQDLEYSDFWAQVNRRVDDEITLEPEPSGWAKAGLVFAHVAGNALSDIILLAVAMVITPTY